MVEPSVPKQTARSHWLRLPAVIVLLISVLAFYWAIDGIEVSRRDYPTIAFVRNLTSGALIAVFSAWFVRALLKHIREWRMPSAEFQRLKAASHIRDAPVSRFGLSLQILMFATWIGLMFLAFLPEALFLVDHQDWAKASAVAPFMLVVMPYLALTGIRALVLGWRRKSAAL